MPQIRRLHQITVHLITLACMLQSARAIPLSNHTGQTIDVEILQIDETRVQIRRKNGDEFWIERQSLSAESQQVIGAITAQQGREFQKINALFGIQLLKDNHLWDDPVNEVARRLQWPIESQTETQSSFRYYPPASYRILQARPHSAAVYGDHGQTSRLSFVFANKGDATFSEPPRKAEIKAMHTAIKIDADQLYKRFRQALGKPREQAFGTARGLKERIKRWDWHGHAFLLATQKGEYVSLRIMPSEAANNGRSQRFSDAALRKLAQQNIKTRSNGDVVIRNIPMVHQGPKGYCVPATFERYLRYMQIPADMYMLAMAGQTNIGGGTSLRNLINAVERYIHSQSRKMEQLQESISIRTVRKYIDKGLPLIWTMHSSDAYNQYANQRTQARKAVQDWKTWATTCKIDARATELSKDPMSAHACLITGYNQATGEIAVSDSWGSAYNERWISAKQAEQVSQGHLYLISF
jgi:hypothetical protein